MRQILLLRQAVSKSEMSAGAGVSFFEMLCANGG
jgi:hypothetical protein